MNDLVQNDLSMSSVEIAELCEKRHDHVIRDITKMLQELDLLNAPKSGAVDLASTYKDAKGEQRKCYNLPKDLTLTLVAGYNVKLRKRIIDRWIELEAQPQQLVPQTLPEALRLAADLAEQNATLKPKAEALDRIATAEGSLSITEAAKSLQLRPKQLFNWLSAHKWIYKRAGAKHWLGYQDKVQQGLLEHKVTTYMAGDVERISEQVRLTPKGISRISESHVEAAA